MKKIILFILSLIAVGTTQAQTLIVENNTSITLDYNIVGVALTSQCGSNTNTTYTTSSQSITSGAVVYQYFGATFSWPSSTAADFYYAVAFSSGPGCGNQAPVGSFGFPASNSYMDCATGKTIYVTWYYDCATNTSILHFRE